MISPSQPMKRKRQLTTTKTQAARPFAVLLHQRCRQAQSISILAVAVGAGVAKAK